MDNPRVVEIDEKLNALAKRREVVEKRIEFREKTLADFSLAHSQSVSRSIDILAKQNEAARVRNIQLLREVGSAAGYQYDRRRTNSKTRTSEQLYRAKGAYISFTEKVLPSWRDHTSTQRAGILRKLQKEKEEAEYRREMTLQEMYRDRQLEVAVEEERRKLVLALTLEERDRLEAQAHSAMLHEQGRAMDSVLQQEFAEFGSEYRKHVEGAALRGALDAKQMVSPLFTVQQQPSTRAVLPRPGETVRVSRVSMQHRDLDPALTRSSVAAQRPTHHHQPPHDEEEEYPSSAKNEQEQQERTALTDYAPPAQQGQLVHFPPEAKVGPRVEEKAPEREVVYHPPPAPSEQRERERGPTERRKKETREKKTPEIEPSSMSKGEGVSVVRSATTDEVAGDDISDVSSENSTPNKQSARPDLKDAPQDTPREERVERARHMLEVNASKQSAALPPKPPVRKSIHNTPVVRREEKEKEEFEPNPAAEVAPEKALTAEMSGLEVANLLRSVCKYLEELDEPLVVKKAYVHADERQSALGMHGGSRVSLIIHRLSGGSEDVGNVLSGSGVSTEELAAIVLRIAVEQGADLLPQEALNGVINVDKITKVQKKLGGHRFDIWQELVNHMRNLIELRRMSQEEICRYITDALIKHIDESDRDRTQRKVMKAVQLAVLPPDKEATPRPSPAPPKTRLPYTSSDTAPTPPSAASSDMFPAPFSPVGSGRLPPGTPPPSVLLTNRSLVQGPESSRSLTGSVSASPGGRDMGSRVPSKTSVSTKILQGLVIDDDEIEDDEIIEAPRVVFKDLSANNGGGGDDDEFDF